MALTTPKMRPLALLGGMTYHATALYYTLINSHIQTRLGGSHSARLLMHSFDHAEMSTYLTTNQWPLLTRSLVQAAQNMKAGGAQAIALCVNTAHKVADELERDGGLQLLHIIDFTAEAVCAKKLIKIALLGTKPVMEEDFMISRLEMKHGLEVVVPGKEHRERMHEVIFGDLGRKVVTGETRRLFLDVLREVEGMEAQGVVLACTELQFVLGQGDTELVVFDTVELHAKGLAEWMLGGE